MAKQPVSGSRPSAEPVPLDELAAGRSGAIAAVDAGEQELERLKAMGLCVGRHVEVQRPGDPLIVKVLGTRIGLSARLATRIRVAPSDE
jgi:Fe2+ transport system protein FeoA